MARRSFGSWGIGTRRVLLALGMAGALGAVGAASATDVPAAEVSATRQTALGPVQGRMLRDGAVQAYLGIPFAQPPVGPLRFEQPRPVADGGVPSSQPLQATRFKPACMQQGKVPADIGMSEDCLYLNLYVPTAARTGARAGAPRPVMVFLHGGRYWTGRASENAVEQLAEQADAVVVTVAYRLNAFGFLADAQRARQGDTNLGLQDQQLALRWLARHVADFGGDPRRLTLFGESAGAGSVLLQLLDPAAKGLFQRAVLQSAWQWRLPTLDEATAGTHALAQRVGCPTAPSAVMTDCLKQVPADKLLPAPADSHAFQPTVDGQRLRAQPLVLLESGRFQRQVPVLIGLNADEGNFMAMSRTGWKRPDQPVDDATYLKAAREALGPFYAPAQVDDILSWYAPQRADQGNWRALSQLLGDFYLNCGSYDAARAFITHGQRPAHAYWFAHVSRNHTKPFLGASHGDELDLLFAAPVYPPGYALTADDRALSLRMMRAWGAFADAGRPTAGAGRAPWPVLDASARLAHVWSEPAPDALHHFEDASGQCARWRPLLR